MTIRKEILMGIIVLICISNISAFAISSDYWNTNPLRLYPGESINVPIILQNLGGTSDLRLKAIVSTGSSVLKLADSNNIYTVPAGEKGQANFVATLPADAKPGQVYNVKIDFAEVKDSKNGEFGFGTAIGQSFDIIALSSEPAKTNRTSIIIVILSIAAGIALLVAIKLILKKIKKKKSHIRHRKRKR